MLAGEKLNAGQKRMRAPSHLRIWKEEARVDQLAIV